jgi:hypothetical protein
MFSPEYRSRLRRQLLDAASADKRITGGAITGSAAADREDRWSDIDLAFGIGDARQVHAVLSDFTTLMYDQHAALHHVDVIAGTWTYRVFLLPDTLQVDLAFTPASEFRALAPTFRLVFGTANDAQPAGASNPAALIGLAWLYALHARTCIARGKLWQAEYMVSGVRDYTLALACLRNGLSAYHGRGIDALPHEVTSRFTSSLIQRLDRQELSRAFRAVLHEFLTEVGLADPALGNRLQETLTSLTGELN